MFRKFKKNKVSLIILLILLVISGVAHGFNMFHFPYYDSDEGVYMSQAWSLITQGKLAPYTYWYDHAPVGWILIALWTKLTGGFFTFGASVNSGRVLMLVLHLASTLLLYYSTKKLTGSRIAAMVASLIFSLSPLGIYFQRRVLLDNIMVFWMLLSLAILLNEKYRLSKVILSAIVFGIAVLTKESAIFFIPVFVYMIYSKSHQYHRSFTVVKWLAVAGAVVSFYFIYALLKGEFAPVGFLGNSTPHVSLLTTLKEQFSRSGSGILDVSKSDFWYNMRIWIGEDPVIVLLGAFATLINLLVGIWNKHVRLAGLLATSYWIFLMRGGVVIEFYVIPLLPLLALNIAVLGSLTHKGISGISSNRFVKAFSYFPQLVLAGAVVLSSFYFATNTRGNLNTFLSDQTTPQVQAIEWTRSNISQYSIVIIDNYGYVDLQDKYNSSSKQFANAEWYWKVDRDDAIKLGLLKNDPSNIDVIAMTPQTDVDLTRGNLTLLSKAVGNATPIKRFWNDGWGVEFWFTRYPKQILSNSWESYKRHFILDGRVIDQQSGITTSEGQSYALLRAVWMDDKKTFDEVLKWSKKHLQLNNSLFAWKLGGSDSNEKTVDRGTATDADQDIVLALLFASKRWNDEQYLLEARQILASIWNEEVVEVEGKPYVIAGNWADHEKSITINPSYLSPSHYRVFAKADKSHPWERLVDTSYRILNECTTAKLDKVNSGVLPPEWCAFDKKTLKVRMPDADQPQATEYSYNAFRVPWRVSLDLLWHESPQAKEYLELLSFLHTEYQEKVKLVAAYQHDGKVWEDYESVLAYTGSIGYFQTLYSEQAEQIYQEKILGKFYVDENNSYWEDPNNYYVQNWAWFGTALYSDNLPNLWDK